ncbi:MAG TPA: EI24 domain-containing protein [Kofleriaceae bacterium]|nr:EI24 domain-containing protein [Kofleriaceae bacterium]
MKELGRGLGDVRRGFAFVNKHPRLWGWVIAPALVTLVLLGAMIYLVVRVADGIVARVTGWLPDALAGAGGWIVWLLVIAALVIGGLVVFVSVAGVVAGPFNELLSEEVEERVTGKPSPAFSLGDFAAGAARGLGHGVKRVFVAVVGALLLFALGFVPVIGTIAAMIGGAYFTARGAAYDSYDAALSRRGLSYETKIAYLARHRSRSLGLGLTVAAMLVIPGLNLLALGLGAAGATLAVLDDPP